MGNALAGLLGLIAGSLIDPVKIIAGVGIARFTTTWPRLLGAAVAVAAAIEVGVAALRTAAEAYSFSPTRFAASFIACGLWAVAWRKILRRPKSAEQ